MFFDNQRSPPRMPRPPNTGRRHVGCASLSRRFSSVSVDFGRFQLTPENPKRNVENALKRSKPVATPEAFFSATNRPAAAKPPHVAQKQSPGFARPGLRP